VVLIDCARQHGTPQQCTVRDNLDNVWKGALFGAAVGALVDAAIPTRAPGGAGSTSAKSRRLSLAFSMRF
jgi:hypothetical protein